MPSPRKGEKEKDFIDRCMGDDEANKTFPDSDQRAAFCHSQWEKHQKKDSAMNPLTVRMKADGSAEILLYDVIGGDFFGEGVTAKDFRAEVKGVKAKVLNLRINSPGGSVWEASAIMAALDEFKGRIEVDVDGIAASAASVVAMAGDEIRVAPAAMIMIHNPMALVVGGAEDMRSMAEMMDKAKGQVLDAYERHSRAGRDRLSAWMDAETWFTGAEAVDAGLAHSVTEGRAVAACAGLKELAAKMHYRKVPEALAAAPAPDPAAWAETQRRRAVAAKL